MTPRDAAPAAAGELDAVSLAEASARDPAASLAASSAETSPAAPTHPPVSADMPEAPCPPGPVPQDMSPDLRDRSVRTLAWLGDAEFEREVRVRLAQRGDYPTDRLHAMTARVVCAEAQAELLAALEPTLDEAELGVVRRARNLNVKAGGRGVRNARDYRSATALEALVAHWCFGAAGGRRRFEALVLPWLATRIDAAVAAASRAPRRG